MTPEEEYEYELALADSEQAPESAPAPDEPAALSPASQSGAALRSFGRGASFGFTPALAGVSGALQELSSRGPLGAAAQGVVGASSLPGAIAAAANAPLVGKAQGEFGNLPAMEAAIARFRSDRDATRRAEEAGARANPKTALAAEVGGALMTPGPKGGSLWKRGAGYAGLGGLMGAGTASSTQGGGWQDVAAGVGLGLLGGGVGEGLSALARPLIRKGASIVGDVVQGRASKDVGDVAKEVAALKGTFGAETQKGSRYLENIQRGVSGAPTMAAPSGISPQTQSAAIQALHSPEAAALQTSVLENTMDAMPNQAAAIERAKQAFQTASAAAPKEAAKRTQDYFAAPLAKTEVLPRLERLSQRLGVAAGAGVGGGLVGGTVGGLMGKDITDSAAIGAASGFGSVMGGQGLLTMARGMAASPRVQRTAVEGVVRGLQRAGEMAPRMGAAAAAAQDAQRSIADPLGPLRSYLSLSEDERRQADTEAFKQGAE